MPQSIVRWALILSCGFSLQCTMSDDPGNPDVSDVRLTIVVTDSTGTPLHGVPLRVIRFPDPQSVFRISDLPTDSLGGLLVDDTLGRTGEAADSFEVVLPGSTDCLPFITQRVVIKRPHGVAQVSADLTASLEETLASVIPGESCGVGYGRFTDGVGSAFWLLLQVDSITDSIRGTWQIDFQATVASFWGSFTGPVRSDSLLLDLVNERVFNPPRCIPRFLLAGALIGQGTQLVRLVDQDACGWNYPSSETPFWLVEYDSPYFP